jgi:hypothetical protein
VEAEEPAGQKKPSPQGAGVAFVEPSGQACPAAQGPSHVAAAFPVELPKKPAAQGAQKEALLAPATLPKVPTGHALHVVAPAALQNPAAQQAPAPTLLPVPPEHKAQSLSVPVGLPAGAPKLKRPAGHEKRSPPPQKEPGGHAWHSAERGPLYVPGGQLVQEEAPVELLLPSAQSVQVGEPAEAENVPAAQMAQAVGAVAKNPGGQPALEGDTEAEAETEVVDEAEVEGERETRALALPLAALVGEGEGAPVAVELAEAVTLRVSVNWAVQAWRRSSDRKSRNRTALRGRGAAQTSQDPKGICLCTRTRDSVRFKLFIQPLCVSRLARGSASGQLKRTAHSGERIGRAPLR